MFQADAADPVGQTEQHVIAIEVAAAEQGQ